MPRIKKTLIADKVDIDPITTEQPEISAVQEKKTVAEDSVVTPVAEKQKMLRSEPPKRKMAKKIEVKETGVPTIQQAPIAIPKPKFKQLHKKDTYWLENDIYQTLIDITKDDRNAKALIINQALKDYFKKKKIAITPFHHKDK